MAKKYTFPTEIFVTRENAATENEYLAASKTRDAAVTGADSDPAEVAIYVLSSVARFSTAIVEVK